jgi:hypothetical protein
LPKTLPKAAKVTPLAAPPPPLPLDRLPDCFDFFFRFAMVTSRWTDAGFALANGLGVFAAHDRAS